MNISGERPEQILNREWKTATIRAGGKTIDELKKMVKKSGKAISPNVDWMMQDRFMPTSQNESWALIQSATSPENLRRGQIVETLPWPVVNEVYNTVKVRLCHGSKGLLFGEELSQ